MEDWILTDIVPVTFGRHGGKRWRRALTYEHARASPVVPVVIGELPQSVVSLPLGFVQNAAGLTLVAILGLKPAENLLVGPEGKWLGTHVPTMLRTYPFSIVALEQARELLCVDEESGLVGDWTDGETFFDGEGQPSAAIAKVLNYLQQVSASHRLTSAACDQLSRCGVVEPWPIVLRSEQGTENIQGLYRINEGALNGLSDEQFLSLRARGALQIAYSQLLSMQHLEALDNFGRRRAQASAAAQKLTGAKSGELDLEFLNQDPSLDFSRF